MDAGGSWNRNGRAAGCATASRLQVKFATDLWHPYAKIFCGKNHVQGKAHTFTIESLNNRIRCYLARLKRRTHNYSKSRENLAASILFFYRQQMRRRTGIRNTINTYLAIPKRYCLVVRGNA